METAHKKIYTHHRYARGVRVTTYEELYMQRISCKTAGLAIVLALALVGSVQAQQQQHQQHHPGGAQAPQQQSAETGQGAPAQSQMTDHMQGMMEHMQGMMGGGSMMGRRGMMGHRGMGMAGHGGTIQHHLERLAQRLELTEEQRTQMWTLLSTHAKEAIRLKADIETLGLDLRQLLEAEPVNVPQVKQVLQAMAGKEADLRLVHITAMQEIGKALTPEQQQKLRAMRRNLLSHGDMMGHGGMMESGRMMGRGRREK
jgi:Spy/CpxP family protein refolding chaperone